MRTSQVVTISLPPALLARVVKRAKAKGMTRSELVREALRRYEREDQEWQALLAYGRRKAQATSIRTDADVERLIDDVRR